MGKQRQDRAQRRVRSVEAAAVAGLAYSLLTVYSLAQMARYPSLSLPEAELTAWFDEPGHQAWLITGLGSASVAAIAFLWFIGVIRRRIGQREDQFFATVFFGSGLVYVAVSLVGSAAIAAPAAATTVLDAAEVSSSSASLAGGLGAALLLIVAPRLQAVFIFTTSTVFLRSHVLPSWVAVVGYIVGSFMFIMPFVWRSLGLAFPIWVSVVSVVLLVRRPSGLGIHETVGDGPDGET